MKKEKGTNFFFDLDGEEFAIEVASLPFPLDILECLETKGKLGLKALKYLYDWQNDDNFYISDEKLTSVSVGDVSKSFESVMRRIPTEYKIFFLNSHGKKFYDLATALGCLQDTKMKNTVRVGIGKIRSY